jgi:galactonate dehydratase
LGGAYRKRIELYANYWFLEGTGSPENYARQAKAMAALGFQACKFDPFAHVHYRWGDDLQLNGSLREEQKQLAMDRLHAVSEARRRNTRAAKRTHRGRDGAPHCGR